MAENDDVGREGKDDRVSALRGAAATAVAGRIGAESSPALQDVAAKAVAGVIGGFDVASGFDASPGFDAATFDSASFDTAAQVIANDRRRLPAAVLSTTGVTEPPVPLLPVEATISIPVSSLASVQADVTAPVGVMPVGASALHAEMLQRIAVLEETLRRLDAEPPGIGHNNPPDPIEPLGYDERRVIVRAIVTLGTEPAEPSNRPPDAAEAAAQVESLGKKVGAYVAKQMDAFVSEAVKSAGSETGKWLVRLGVLNAVAVALAALAKVAYAWLHSLPPPL